MTVCIYRYKHTTALYYVLIFIMLKEIYSNRYLNLVHEKGSDCRRVESIKFKGNI